MMNRARRFALLLAAPVSVLALGGAAGSATFPYHGTFTGGTVSGDCAADYPGTWSGFWNVQIPTPGVAGSTAFVQINISIQRRAARQLATAVHIEPRHHGNQERIRGPPRSPARRQPDGLPSRGRQVHAHPHLRLPGLLLLPGLDGTISSLNPTSCSACRPVAHSAGRPRGRLATPRIWAPLASRPQRGSPTRQGLWALSARQPGGAVWKMSLWVEHQGGVVLPGGAGCTMKHNKALGVALVAALSGSLIGCSSDSATTASSTTPAPATPSISATSGGSITVALTDLAGHEGEHVAGVLLKDYPGPDVTGVAGFVTPIDSDPFTQQQVLGNVPEQWPEPINPETAIGWPWPRGVADVPPGDYTLMLWAARDNFCCYSQWIPAQTAGLTGCQLRVTTTGEPQTVTIKGLSNNFERICTSM